MKYQSLSPNKEYCVRLDKHDEIISSLTNFCITHKIKNAVFSGIGATNSLTIGSFDLKTKKYENINIKKPLEILSLVGNVSLVNGSPFVHAHVVVGKDDFKTLGGHLRHCVVSLTCEIYLLTYKNKINRSPNKSLGISILDL
jgi:predicted DNA-binding protein with PD1-like motif